MLQRNKMILLFLTLLIFNGCSTKVYQCNIPKLKTIYIKHKKFTYKKAKYNYIVPIKQFDEHLQDYLETIKALKFMNKQAEYINEIK